MRIQDYWEKAKLLRGCLWESKTIVSRRRHASDEDPFLIDPFVSDEAKILSSKTFRVMSDKTQVFSFPRTPLVRSRMKHVHEVVAHSVVTAEFLGLNEKLVRAAALGHDIGHVPFGHQGEAWMKNAMGRPEFCHEVMGPIIAQKIERKGKGLNLTRHTLEAMMCHSGNLAHPGMSQEAWTLRYTDKIAYLFHDVNDIMMRARYPVSQELRELVAAFGETQRERGSTAIAGLVIESAACGRVSFEESDLGRKFKRLRTLMYEDVYPHVTQQKVEWTMGAVLDFLEMIKIADPFLILALMTDHDARLIAEAPMKDINIFNQTAVSEITPYLQEIGTINLCDPNLDW